jgi:hypothetical protein
MTRRTLGAALVAGAAAASLPANEKAAFLLLPGHSVGDLDGLKHFVPLKPDLHTGMPIYFAELSHTGQLRLSKCS